MQLLPSNVAQYLTGNAEERFNCLLQLGFVLGRGEGSTSRFLLGVLPLPLLAMSDPGWVTVIWALKRLEPSSSRRSSLSPKVLWNSDTWLLFWNFRLPKVSQQTQICFQIPNLPSLYGSGRCLRHGYVQSPSLAVKKSRSFNWFDQGSGRRKGKQALCSQLPRRCQHY